MDESPEPSNSRIFRFMVNEPVRNMGSLMGTKFVRAIFLRKVRQVRTKGSARAFRNFREGSTECCPMPAVVPTGSRNCLVIR
jgi:hypothetical protein